MWFNSWKEGKYEREKGKPEPAAARGVCCLRCASNPPDGCGASSLGRTFRLSYFPSFPLAGFTLIEIIVVIAVVAILASLVSPMVFRNVGDAKAAAARAQVEILAMALDAYRLDNDFYPSTVQGLQSLRETPEGSPRARNWRGPYLRRDIPVDPWGREYVYLSPGSVNPESYDLVSLGRDGQVGGEEEDRDMTSW